MNENNESILIQEGSIDLKYLADILAIEHITSTFEGTLDGFLSKCKSIKYSAIILTVADNKTLNEEYPRAISWSPNIFSPVLVVSPVCEPDLLETLQRYKFEYIKFPFTPVEFLFRLRRIMRLKHNEEIVHDNLMKYRTLCDNFPVGIVQTDKNGKFTGINPAFATMMCMNEADLYRENFFRLCHPDDYFIERKQLDRLLRKEVKTVNFEIRLINNDGNTSVCKIVANSLWENDLKFNSFTYVIERVI